MSPQDLALIATLLLGYSLISRWLAHRSISGPLAFSATGAALAIASVEVLDGAFIDSGVELMAEATLVILLFSDATRIDPSVLRRQAELPARMLGIGLPLTVVAGTLAGVVLIPGLTLLEAAVLAAIMAPTDAALGQAVVSDRRVPVRVRQALNVESGLNDGLMAPTVAILVGLAVMDGEAGGVTNGEPVEFIFRQLGFGLSVGLAVGLAGGWLLDRAVGRGWVEGEFRQIGVLAIAVCSFAFAEVFDGNGFVAAFVAGIAFGAIAQPHCDSATDFAEDEGQLLVALTFLIWGVSVLGPRLDDVSLDIALYVILSLTVVRMIPVALSLLGSGLEWPTVGYLGWFGPRGLASIIFGLFALEHLEGEVGETIFLVVTWTCAVSIVAHGLSAVPLAARYGEWFASMDDEEMAAMPEAVEVEPMRVRMGSEQ